MNKFELNKLSSLHDGKKIFFSKIDFVSLDFEYINTLNNDVILISGNGDFPIDDELIKQIPNNVKFWFGVNSLSYHPKLIAIPIGLENSYDCIRDNHGIGYKKAIEKDEIIDSLDTSIVPNKLIYSNFLVDTNRTHRTPFKEISEKLPYIDWEEPKLNTVEYLNNILNYEAVLCPAGNGVDTHRLWEVLYMKRIPITVKIGNYKLYDLYEKLPILVLDNISELENEKFIIDKINEIKNRTYDLSLLDLDFWKNKILNLI